jgi:hypothetical protein
MQRGNPEEIAQDLIRDNLLREGNVLTSSPMAKVGGWKQKSAPSKPVVNASLEKTGGRGRSRKRSMLYNSLSAYHNKFLHLLTAEYKAEVSVWKTLMPLWQRHLHLTPSTLSFGRN